MISLVGVDAESDETVTLHSKPVSTIGSGVHMGAVEAEALNCF